jgi:hypothetical protein
MALLWTASLVDFAVAGWLLFDGGRGGPAFVAPLLLAAGVFQLHALYGTDYTVDADTLHIRASLFRWHVPLAAIESIEPTSNPLSSPALSLDRWRIRYGGKRIMVSPADPDAFLRALAARGVAAATRSSGR